MYLLSPAFCKKQENSKKAGFILLGSKVQDTVLQQTSKFNFKNIEVCKNIYFFSLQSQRATKARGNSLILHKFSFILTPDWKKIIKHISRALKNWSLLLLRSRNVTSPPQSWLWSIHTALPVEMSRSHLYTQSSCWPSKHRAALICATNVWGRARRREENKAHSRAVFLDKKRSLLRNAFS